MTTFTIGANRFFSSRLVVWLLYLLAFGITLQCYLISIGKEYTRYNNYVIFRSAFEHLRDNLNLYASYPAAHYDFFKYSPSFAAAMGAFCALPDWIGTFAFNFLNLFVFIIGLKRIGFSEKKLKWVLLFLFVETGISLSSLQTNLLIAGCIMLAFSFLEEGRPAPAALLITITVFIKLFGLVAFSLFLLYPKKFQFVAWAAAWTILVLLLPLVMVSPADLIEQYGNWLRLLREDHGASTGLSFMGWMSGMFGIYLPKLVTVLTAAILFCIPLLRPKRFQDAHYRLLMLASVLLWIVIFNHKGESPTYVIAMAGVAIWYFTQLPNKRNLILLWLCLIFTSFSSTDAITPLWIIAKYVDPLSLKSVFTSIIWFLIIFELVTDRFRPDLQFGFQKPETVLSQKT